MSTSTAAAPKKPKRPLSGYNLFYRYKRNKVVEATARPDADNEANIRAVLVAPSGLEGVPPDSPVLRLPPARLNEFRAAAIKTAMEGKLFPNENGRDRVHCKVHGMGFVEMGRMVRQTWGRADKLTKDVFNDLADVGRVRYRRLAAEYKSSNPPAKVQSQGAPAEEPVKSQPSSDPLAEALSAWATNKPPRRPSVAEAPVPHQARSFGRSRGDFFEPLSLADATDFQAAPVPRQARTHGRGRGDFFDPFAFAAAMSSAADAAPAPAEGGARPGRRFSSTAAELDLCDPSLFEPLPYEKGPAARSNSDGPGRGRRVSNTAVELDLCDPSIFEEPIEEDDDDGPVDASAFSAALAAFGPAFAATEATKDDGGDRRRRSAPAMSFSHASSLAAANAAKREGARQRRRVSARPAEIKFDASLFQSAIDEDVGGGDPSLLESTIEEDDEGPVDASAFGAALAAFGPAFAATEATKNDGGDRRRRSAPGPAFGAAAAKSVGPPRGRRVSAKDGELDLIDEEAEGPVAASAFRAGKGSAPSQGRRVSMPSTAAEFDVSLFESLAEDEAEGPGAPTPMETSDKSAAPAAGYARGRRASMESITSVEIAALVEEEGEIPGVASTFESAPMETGDKSAAPGTGRGRRASTESITSVDIAALLGGAGGAAGATGDGGAGSDSGPAPMETGDKSAAPEAGFGRGRRASTDSVASVDIAEGLKATLEQQVSLRMQMQKIRDQIIQNNSLLPSGMRVSLEEGAAPEERPLGVTSSSEAARNNSDPSVGDDGHEKGEASAKDFGKLFNVLGEAIDDHGMDAIAT